MTIRSDYTPRVQKKRNARINEILNSAMDIVIADGIDSLTIQRLANRLDYIVGALYRYFSSKDAIIAALGCRAINQLHEQVQAVIAQDSPDDETTEIGALYQILKISELYVSLYDHAPAIYKLLGMMLSDPREFIDAHAANPVLEATETVLRDIAESIKQAQNAGAIDAGNNEERAVIFWSAHQGITQLRKLERIPKTSFRVLPLSRAFQKTLLLGWGAKRENVLKAFEIATKQA